MANAPSHKLSLNDCFLLYSLRWQIELWKTHAKLKHSVSANTWRVLCEIYAKLLSVIISHWLIHTGLWQRPGHSLVKGCQMIREQSARLAPCVNDLTSLIALLEEIRQRFEYGCSLNMRKKQPYSCQQFKSGLMLMCMGVRKAYPNVRGGLFVSSFSNDVLHDGKLG